MIVNNNSAKSSSTPKPASSQLTTIASSLLRKKFANNNHKKSDDSDAAKAILNNADSNQTLGQANNLNMSCVYKQNVGLNQTKKSIKPNIILNRHSISQIDSSSDYLNQLSRKDSFENIDSAISTFRYSTSSTKSVNSNSNFSSSPSPTNSNLNSQQSSDNLVTESQTDEEIQSTMSPISSTTSGISPHLTNGNNNNNSNNNNMPMSPRNNSTTTTAAVIPTRFMDRRVSTGVFQSDPYKFNVNYVEAGKKLAKKAQEQLKTVEKSKDLKQMSFEEAEILRKREAQRANEALEVNGDDWQHVCLKVSYLGL